MSEQKPPDKPITTPVNVDNPDKFRTIAISVTIIVPLAIIMGGLMSLFFIIYGNIVEVTTPPLIQLFPLGESADASPEQAMESVNLMLSFIQAGSIIITAIAVAATTLGVWNSRRLDQEVATVKGLYDEIKELKTLAEQLKRDSTNITAIRAETQNAISGFEHSLNEAAKINQFNLSFGRAFSQLSLAQRQIEMNNLPEAVSTLHTAQSLASDNAIICYILGDTLARQGKIKDGIKMLEKALRIANIDDENKDKDFYDAKVSYAYARRMQGDAAEDYSPEQDELYAEAEKIFLNVAKRYPMLQDISGESAFGALAGLYRRRNDIERAIKWYQNAERATPQQTYPINNLALIYFEQKKDKEADEYFTRAKKLGGSRSTLNPSDIWSYFDYITACIGLSLLHPEEQPYSLEEAQQDVVKLVELVFSTTRSKEPLRKFKGGLSRLCERKGLAKDDKAFVEAIIEQVDNEANDEKYNNEDYYWVKDKDKKTDNDDTLEPDANPDTDQT